MRLVETSAIRNIWKSIAAGALLLGLVSSIISIWTFVRVDKLEKLVAKSRDWEELRIDIANPQNNSRVEGFMVKVAGKIIFKLREREVTSPLKVNLDLIQQGVELACFIRSVTTEHVWYLQPKPVVSQNGEFEIYIFLGEKNKEIDNLKFQIVVLAVPSESMPRGYRHADLPSFYFEASKIITVIKN